MISGAQLIANERERQMNVEGWTPANDNAYQHAELELAAKCYIGHAIALIHGGEVQKTVPKEWPWDPKWWKPSHNPVRDLMKAGALTAAAIDRLERLRHAQMRITEWLMKHDMNLSDVGVDTYKQVADITDWDILQSLLDSIEEEKAQQ